MNKRQFQLNGYASLFGNYYDALFIYSKFGSVGHYSEGKLKLTNLNTRLVNKIMFDNQLLSGSNYVLRECSGAKAHNFDVRLTKVLEGKEVFSKWLDKNNFKNKLRLQNFIVSGLILDSSTFNRLTRPLYFYMQNNILLLNLNQHLGFSNNLKMHLIFPIMSLTLLNFLKLLLNPLKATLSAISFIKNNIK